MADGQGCAAVGVGGIGLPVRGTWPSQEAGRLHSLDYESLSFAFGSGKPEKCLEVERSCVGSSSYWQLTPPPPPRNKYIL